MFNLIEESLVHCPYFVILNKDNSTYELQSRNQVGCWKVQKNDYPSVQFFVYHKSSFYGEYHYFETVESVKDAIDQTVKPIISYKQTSKTIFS